MQAVTIPSKTRSSVKPESIFPLIGKGLWEQSQRVRSGLPSSFVVEVSDALSVPRKTFLSQLNLSRSTIEQRIKSNALLSTSEGDAVLRTAKALSRAEEVFDSRESAATWFKTGIRSLGGVTPFSLMDTESGYELVVKTLGRIEYGVVA